MTVSLEGGNIRGKKRTDQPAPAILAGGIGGVSIGQHFIDGEIIRGKKVDGKPAFVIPTMREIAKTKQNGYTVASTFSGCGGSCLGYKMAGFRVAWASEFVEEARQSYIPNHPGTILDPRDIRMVKGSEILQAIGIEKGFLDVFDGSPPCQSFSMAGRRQKNWGRVMKHGDGSEQRSDDLFFEYIRLVDEIQPRTFIAENVAGLVRGAAKGYFLRIIDRMKKSGYKVKCKVLDAQWLGVPQTRQRAIFIGVRDDLGTDPEFPRPLPYRYSIADALTGIKMIHQDTGGHFRKISRGSSGLAMTITTRNSHHLKVDAAIDGYAIADEWDKTRRGGKSEKFFSLVKPSTNRPSPTITSIGGESSIASVVHPTERRKFTIDEVKRLCSFPDDFVLVGSFSQQWARLGNAVPPVMMYHIASKVGETLRKIDG